MPSSPNLVGIDGLVPEHAFFGARLGLELAVDGVHGGTVLGLAHQVIELVEGLARIDVIEVVLLGFVMLYGTVVLDNKSIYSSAKVRWRCSPVISYSSMSALIMQPSI